MNLAPVVVVKNISIVMGNRISDFRPARRTGVFQILKFQDWRSNNIVFKFFNFSLFLFFTLLIFHSSAQDKKGSLVINKDPRLDELIERHITENAAIKNFDGFRIQLLASRTKDEVLNLRAKFRAKHPDTKTYLLYQQPYFKLRIGNFKERLSAQKFLDQIHAEFSGAFIVTEEIPFEEMDSK